MKTKPWLLLGLAAMVVAVQPAAAQLEMKSEDGSKAFKIGLLGQMWADKTELPGGEDQDNMFFRRLRILMNFKLSDKLSVFLETDSPNLGKATTGPTKDAGDVYIQDFLVTYSFTNAFKLEGGMILAPLSYNHLQSAASLMPIDYGPYSFVENTPLNQRIGRDYGLQARGYLGNDHFEYRVAILGGLRGTDSTNDFRYVGRVVYWVFGPQTGPFYRGTSLGKSKSLGIGAFYDTQEDYSANGIDVFYEQPFGDGNGFTVQADWVNFDGDVFVTLPEQTDLLVELGLFFKGARLQPFIQYSNQDLDVGADTTKTQIGLAYHISGHNNTLKLGFMQTDPDGGDKTDQITLQWQIMQW